MTKTSLVLLVGFWFPSLVGRAKDKIDEKKLSSWKLLDDFRRRLANAQAAVPAREKRPGGPVRLLLEEVFLKLAGEIPTSWGDALIFIHKSQAPSWGPAIHPRSGGICPPCP